MAKAKEKATKKKMKQQYIAGTEPPSIPELDDAAADYLEKRNARMEMQDEELQAQQKLQMLMHDHGLTVYHTEIEGLLHKVEILNGEERVKVRRDAKTEE